MIYLVDDIRNRLLGQISYCVYSSHFHFFIYGARMHIKRTSEYIWETYYIVYLIRIITSTCWHQHIWTTCHGIFVADFRHRICQSKNNRTFRHRTYHVLSKHIAFGQSHEDIGTLYSFFQSMHISALGCKQCFLRSQFFSIGRNHALWIKHYYILTACAKCNI